MSKGLRALGVLALVLAAASGCGSGVGGLPRDTGVQDSERTIHYVSSMLETQGSARIIGELASEYGGKHPEVRYSFENVNTSDLLQKIQLLAASNDLPELFSFESGKPLEELADHGFVVDLEQAFKELGLYDRLNPAAVKLLKSMVGGKGLYALPLEMNIEGFWYNKRIFESCGLREPRTWTELMESADVLQRHGVQPFALAGAEKWPITRLINGYVIRLYGSAIMQRVSRGEVRVTEPGFIEAAGVVQGMALKGYLGDHVNTTDLNEAAAMFLNGKAAMFYSGSWSLRDFNDPTANAIGPKAIGLFNIPLVEGGAGTEEDWLLHAGLTTSFSAAAYDDKMKGWMKSVFRDYGDRAIHEMGYLPGFKVDRMPDELPPLTKMVQQKIDGVKNGTLWFEALFDPEAQTVAWNNAQLLVSNEDFTPSMYMEELQQVLDKQKKE
ncbi:MULTISPECIES: extracellular solute-binding protein [unclassified Paenibacillus]|uniref:ABC transporter substrate-binding protein n=1 Tax=unclassified Paenibacillus TaxID=185978 RepID=UPI0009556C8F|nr:MULTISPECIES: extracellular solute-binding protein [unclassified Paenibacillus]ASS68615.1 extracellular solute-binding protein [Paenibacillus sp. RUD330]SIR64714.1 raffinose/stachyose/melibiose transport system substrate-binding protein [Paenibacillus sp. RU4X]SIR72642.1 raffinose/stachyose/melibiose transport system substrate-binding protein [Paenibacillus sp. RU4T]